MPYFKGQHGSNGGSSLGTGQGAVRDRVHILVGLCVCVIIYTLISYYFEERFLGDPYLDTGESGTPFKYLKRLAG